MLLINTMLIVFSPIAAIFPMLFLSYRVLKNNDIMYINPWNIGLLFLFVWSFIAGLINGNPLSATLSIMFLLYFLSSIYIQNYYLDENKIENLLKNLVLFSIGSSFIGLAERYWVIHFGRIPWGRIFYLPEGEISSYGYRISATFGNPNVAGAWLGCMILAAVYFYYNSSKMKKLLYALVVCLFIIVFCMTGSRGAGLSLLFGLAVYGALLKDKKKLYFIMFVFVSVSLLMFVLPNVLPSISAKNAEDAASTIVDSISDPMTHSVDSSVSSRGPIWKDCINMFKLKPLTGWGLLGIFFGNRKLFPNSTGEPHAHNILLTFASTLGIAGVIAYLNMKFYLYKTLKHLYRSNCRLVPLLTSIQAMIAAHGVVDCTIAVPQIGILFVLCSACTIALSMQYSGEKDVLVSTWFDKHKAAKINF